jgi:UDP-GlcNAc:undecaprenyl-phosphate GlcNAc-1-phosphate transferase
MGDTGSMFLGFILATTSIRANLGESGAVSVLVPIIALGLPITDTLLAMTRRAARGVPMFRGDRGHIHHRLLDRGLSHRDTVLVLYGVAVVLASTALLVSFAAQALWFLAMLAGAAYFLLRKLGFLTLDDAHAAMKERRRNLVTQGVVRRAGRDVRDAASLDDVWRQVRRVGRVLGATCVGMAIASEDGEAATWSEGLDEAPLSLLRVRYGLNFERPGANYVEFGWSDGRTSVDRDSEIAIELLCHHLTGAVERLEDERGYRYGMGRVLRFGG